ncbi:PQQ-dependent sugar dehydrogenase [Fluviicola chungangensis]|uniref:T9SS type A sorting domain-containing protein n=1 Tax=Fluviicola chungangensis TaxID=2597671 RepID=A0A556N6X0_9FLAO|nr:PQQ-dependent sugar dehydrogenase [Fluviicola chungangensis]TSJ47932.1 T9SS type A sorting domain-containing protein [Fluviicola chungangensis]
MEFKKILFIVLLGFVPLVHAQTAQQVGATTVYIDTLATNSSVPWEITLEGENYLWVTERDGLVSRINLLTGIKDTVLDIRNDIHAVGESGLLGMALHPDFPVIAEVFLVYTYGPEDSQGYFNECLVKYTYDGTDLTIQDTLIDSILAYSNHDGSRLHFLPDKTLLMSTGECSQDQLAQDPNSLSGKYLRVNTDGTIPDDNPDPGSYIYTMGHRNSQGICTLPNGTVIISEHGPTTDDELSVLEPGKNYGWPLVHGFCDEPFEDTPCATGLYQEPIYAWTPTIATADLVYYDNLAFPEWDQRILLTTLNGQRLVALKLNATASAVIDEDQYFFGQFGRLRDIAIGPNLEIYIATNSGTNPIIKIITPNSLGVKEFDANASLVIPNPADNYIQLMPGNAAEQVSILDLNGKTVLEFKNVEAGQHLDITKLATGTYAVEVKFVENDQVQRSKLMK